MTTERAVIWDVDGTLVDTAELHHAAFSRLCAELERPYTPADFAATFGLRNPEVFEKLFPGRFTVAESSALADCKEEYYRDSAREGVDLLPGVRLLLELLAGAGFRQGIGSSAPRKNLELILMLTRIGNYFGAVIAGEDCKRGKPNPEVFLLAAEQLSVPPGSCVVIEDAPAGIQAARQAGMRCVGVSFAGHHPEEALRAAGADCVVRSLIEMEVSDIESLIAHGR